MPSTPPLFHKVDSLQLPVPTLDAGLAFYRDALGHQLLWRTELAAGLRMSDSETEIVVQTERHQPEVDLLVESVERAAERVVAAGGALLAGPREIPVGRVVAVADPFGNSLVLLELSKGHYRTDASGAVIGVER
jgi:predicted enzyme related to lactoylglutathione lyase